MTKGFLTIAAVLALVLLFAAAAVPEEITIPETEPIIAPELTVSAHITKAANAEWAAKTAVRNNTLLK